MHTGSVLDTKLLVCIHTYMSKVMSLCTIICEPSMIKPAWLPCQVSEKALLCERSFVRVF